MLRLSFPRMAPKRTMSRIRAMTGYAESRQDQTNSTIACNNLLPEFGGSDRGDTGYSRGSRPVRPWTRHVSYSSRQLPILARVGYQPS
jgi:hypothetical protein